MFTGIPSQEKLCFRTALPKEEFPLLLSAYIGEMRHGAIASSSATATTKGKFTIKEKNFSASFCARSHRIAPAVSCLPGVWDTYSGIFLRVQKEQVLALGWLHFHFKCYKYTDGGR